MSPPVATLVSNPKSLAGSTGSYLFWLSHQIHLHVFAPVSLASSVGFTAQLMKLKFQSSSLAQTFSKALGRVLTVSPFN